MTRAAALALGLMLAGGSWAQGVAEPPGYRGPPYAAQVPETLAGARVIGGDEARALHARGVTFIDVYPRVRRPAGLPADTLWRQPVHRSIPGALWLPEAGFQRVSLPEAARFLAGLEAATGGDRAAPVVIFCLPDCWLSWNAARRAVAAGYTGVLWFPEGSDGWETAGGELVPLQAPGG